MAQSCWGGAAQWSWGTTLTPGSAGVPAGCCDRPCFSPAGWNSQQCELAVTVTPALRILTAVRVLLRQESGRQEATGLTCAEGTSLQDQWGSPAVCGQPLLSSTPNSQPLTQHLPLPTLTVENPPPHAHLFYHSTLPFS